MRVLPIIALFPLVAGLVANVGDHMLVSQNVKTLQAAKSLTLGFTVTVIGGESISQTLSVARPNLLRWETPTKLIVADSKKVYELDKVKNTYTETPQGALFNSLLSEENAWVWSAFADADFAKSLKSAKDGKSRTIQGVKVVEVIVNSSGKEKTLLFDPKLSLFRGAMFDKRIGDTIQPVVIYAKDIKVGADEGDRNLYSFNPGSATREDITAMATLTYQDVRPILEGNCTSCHDDINLRGGVSLSSYMAIMNGRKTVVVAGDPDASLMIKMIRNGEMPPRGKLPTEKLDKLVKWVKDGAKEK